MSSWIPGLSWLTGSKEETETYLGEGDQGFTYLSTTGPDDGLFGLREVREPPEQPDRGGARIVGLPKGHYEKAPQLAKGLKSCHLSHTSKDKDGKQAIDLMLALSPQPANTSTLRPLIQAGHSNEKTQLIYDAEMTWLEAKQEAKDCMIVETTFHLAKGEKKHNVKFPRPFPDNVEIDINYWIQGFRFASQNAKEYAVNAWATDVKYDGFTAHASGSDNAERLTVTWIAHKRGKKKVASGSFGTDGVDGRKENAAESEGRVDFPEGTFSKPPTVLVALSQMALAAGRDLRLGVSVEKVDETGFTWHLNTWGENSEDALRSAQATYVALDYS